MRPKSKRQYYQAEAEKQADQKITYGHHRLADGSVREFGIFNPRYWQVGPLIVLNIRQEGFDRIFHQLGIGNQQQQN